MKLSLLSLYNLYYIVPNSLLLLMYYIFSLVWPFLIQTCQFCEIKYLINVIHPHSFCYFCISKIIDIYFLFLVSSKVKLYANKNMFYV